MSLTQRLVKFRITIVVVMPNITTNHAITYTNLFNRFELEILREFISLLLLLLYSVLGSHETSGGNPRILGMVRWLINQRNAAGCQQIS